MAVKTIRTDIHTCDICGAECVPVRENTQRLKFIGDGGADVNISFSAEVFYGASNGDVCKECAIKSMEKAIEKLKRDA